MSGRPRRARLPGERSLRKLCWIIPLGIAGNLGYTLLATDRQALRATLDLQAGWLALALVLALAPLVLNALRVWRWGRLLQPGFSRRAAARTVLAAEVGAAVTPSAVGGAPLKIAVLARSGFGASGGVTLTALGSIEDVVAVLIVVPAAAVLSGLAPRFAAMLHGLSESAWPGHGIVVTAAVVLGVASVSWLLLGGRRGRRRRVRMRRWWREVVAYVVLIHRCGLPTFLGNVVLATAQWTSRLSIVAALTAGLGAPIAPVRSLVLQWICFTGMTFTPTPGAVGGAEAAFLLVFGRELPPEIAPLALASWRVVTFYGLTLIALALLGAGAVRESARLSAPLDRHARCPR